MSRFSTRAKLIAGALALVLAGVSHATGTQVGGGATLPSFLYVGPAAANLVPGTTTLATPQVTDHLPAPAGTGAISATSLLGAYDKATGNTSSYCLTGTGSGKNILAGIADNSVQNACSTAAAGLHGFGAPLVGRTDLAQPNFVAADVPLSITDYLNYTNVHGNNDGKHFPVQFPVVAGSIAIAFNLEDITGAPVTSAEVNFSDLQVCEIFSGTVTAWNDPRLASAFTLPPGRSIPANPINVEYRADGSGTTFGFSNHLSAVCAAAGLSGGPFEASQNFVGAAGITGISGAVTSNFFTTAPAGWTGSSGNGGVEDAIALTPNSVGYVELANVLATFAPGLWFAKVNGKAPDTDFNVTAITGAAIAFNQVINPLNSLAGTAQLEAITTNPPTGQCIAIVRPNKYDKPGELGGIVPSGSYPIVDVSYFLGNNLGNGTDLGPTQGLVTSPYNPPAGVAAVTGLKFVTLPATGAPFTAATVSSCYGL